MKAMSGYITKLEEFPDLEVSIIRVTKINKVLKAILKLDNIPKEEEFKFKPRSQVLLEKWNKLLADGGSSSAKGAVANGVNGTSTEPKSGDKPEAGTNGVKTNGDKKLATPSADEPVKTEEEKVR
jgi:hypothetical protein